MFQTLLATSKSRREYQTKLYEKLNAAVYGYGGAVLHLHPSLPDALSIKLVKETTDLKRFLRLPSTSHFLHLNRHNQETSTLLKLTEVPAEPGNPAVVAQSAAPWSHLV